jgi:hypothetical protein
LNGSSEAAFTGEALNSLKGPENAVAAMTRLLCFKKDLLVIPVFMVYPRLFLSVFYPFIGSDQALRLLFKG